MLVWGSVNIPDEVTLYARLIRQELEKLRRLDPLLPFGVLTVLIEKELSNMPPTTDD
jgi:hypothetical protein